VKFQAVDLVDLYPDIVEDAQAGDPFDKLFFL